MRKFGTMRKAAAGIVAAAMLSVGAAGLVSIANAAEVNSNDITITQPAAVQNQLIQPTVNGRTFKAYRISDYSNAQVNDDGQITGYDENTKNTNDFAKTGGVIMTMLALAGAATAAGVIAGVAAKRRTNKA